MARKKKERESSLHLTDKHHPLLGIVATLLAVLSAGMFGSACVAASGSNGHAGLLVGFVGICSLVVAGVGFVLAWIIEGKTYIHKKAHISKLNFPKS